MSTVVGNLSVELGISDDQLRAGLAAAMAQAQAAGNNISNSMNRAAGSSTKGFAQLSLSISRLADDAQYGFRGVINNLEQLGTGAALALGASTSAAMMFGGALTLAGIAINALLPVFDKMIDGRNAFEKIASSAAGFAGNLNMTNAEMKLLAEQTNKLMEMDATGGLFAGGERLMQGVRNPDKSFDILGEFFRGRTQEFFNEIITPLTGFKPRSRLEQERENRSIGQSIIGNQVIMATRLPELNRQQANFRAGAEILSLDTINQETSKQIAEVFNQQIKGQAKTAYQQLNAQFVAAKVPFPEAQQRSLSLLGEAASGVKKAFDDLAQRIPDLQLTENLNAVMNGKEVEENMKQLAETFRKRQSLIKQQNEIQGNVDNLQLQRQRSEIIGASDVFQRNFNASLEKDPVVSAIEKQTEDLDRIMKEIKELN
jgi:hypothetical protein